VIQTFLFDMGNVLVHFCHDRMCRQMGALCGRTGDEVRSLLFGSELQHRFECGHVNEDEFHREFERLVEREVEFASLLHAGSDIFTENEAILPVLASLKRQGHRLVLLSNTSVSHYEFVRRNFRVLEPFDDLVLSFEVGAMKPQPAIYEAALTMIECPPEHCFYTDDIPAYVEAGRRFGLQAEVFTDAATLRKQLAARGIEV